MNFDKFSWAGLRGSIGVVLFDETALQRLSRDASLLKGILFLLVLVLAQVLSLSQWEEFHLAFLAEGAKLVGSLLALYVVIKVLSSEAHFDFEKFLCGILLACIFGLALVWLLIAFSFVVFDSFGISAVRLWLMVARNYYVILLFGFSAEHLCGLKGWKSVAIGLVGITVFYILSSFL